MKGDTACRIAQPRKKHVTAGAVRKMTIEIFHDVILENHLSLNHLKKNVFFANATSVSLDSDRNKINLCRITTSNDRSYFEVVPATFLTSND